MGYTDADNIHYRTPSQLGLTLIIIFGYFSQTEAAAASYSANSIPASSSGCSPTADTNCLKCNIEGCIKCPALLNIDTRQCTNICPSGYLEQWSTSPEFMGRICQPTGLSGPLLATIVGLASGFLVCLTLVIVSVFLVKRKRRRKTIEEKLINENNIDRSDFLKQLDDLRPDAEYFLAMLNDARRQIRKLHLSGETATANTYRPIVRDLAKLLILLNRPIEIVPAPPHNWSRIHSWAERALERYKPQVGQLIDFLQSPNDSRLGSYQHSTFKSTTTASTMDSTQSHQTQQQLRLFGSLISLHEFDEPRSNNPFVNNYNHLKGNLIASDIHASSLWLEDEFFKLGFRPQDEITTEL